jgi:cytochrome c6
MKKNFLTLSILLTTLFLFGYQAKAADIESGERIFTANCAACHAGGNNVIMPEKTLRKDALETNGMNSISAITYQVTNGKNAMPAFGGRLSDTDIEDVANYVLSQSEKGWD